MRSLFHAKEESRAPSVVAYDPSPLAAVAESAPLSVATNASEAVSTMAMANGMVSAKRQHARRGLTPRERIVRARRLAYVTLAVSLAAGGRWFVANQEPTYPAGQGVYPSNAVPKWGTLKQPNAATFYMAAGDALDLEAVNKALDADYNTLTLKDAPASVQKAPLAVAQPAFALLRQGMNYPFCPEHQTNYYSSNPFKGQGLSRPVPNFIVLREMSRLLAADASYRGHQGDYVGAMESSLDTVRLGVDTGQGHMIIDGMIGVLIQGIGAKEGMKHVADLSASDARAGAKRLETVLTNQVGFSQMMTYERDMQYEIVKELYHERSFAGMSDFAFGSLTEPTRKVADELAYDGSMMWFTKQGIVNDLASQFDIIIGRGKIPYQSAKKLGEVKPSANPLVHMIAPDTTRALRHFVVKTTWNHVLLGRLAVQAYKGEHGGASPASLAVLTGGTNPYLKSVPTDPFSVSGSDPLRYNAPTGDVHSVSENGTDDHGTGDDDVELHAE